MAEQTIRHTMRKYKRWLQLAVWLFGERSFRNRIKTHMPAHWDWIITMLCSDPYGSEAYYETAHIRAAKIPYKNTDRWCRILARTLLVQLKLICVACAPPLT